MTTIIKGSTIQLEPLIRAVRNLHDVAGHGRDQSATKQQQVAGAAQQLLAEILGGRYDPRVAIYPPQIRLRRSTDEHRASNAESVGSTPIGGSN